MQCICSSKKATGAANCSDRSALRTTTSPQSVQKRRQLSVCCRVRCELPPRENSDFQRWPNTNEIKSVNCCWRLSNGPSFVGAAAPHQLVLPALQRLPVRGGPHHLMVRSAEPTRHNHSSSRSAVKAGSTEKRRKEFLPAACPQFQNRCVTSDPP